MQDSFKESDIYLFEQPKGYKNSMIIMQNDKKLILTSTRIRPVSSQSSGVARDVYYLSEETYWLQQPELSNAV
jgi:hypothetical protein